MTLSKPPVIATWLLQHFLPSNGEHITGDLIEQFHRNHSRLHYWKEAIIAILVSVFDEGRSHPILAARAVAVGWAISFLFKYLWFSKPVYLFLATHIGQSGYPFAPSFLIGFGLGLFFFGVSGWVVARLHPINLQTGVLLYAISNFLFQLRVAPDLWRGFENALTNSRFVPYLIFGLEAQFLPPLAILLGGLLRLKQVKVTPTETTVS